MQPRSPLSRGQATSRTPIRISFSASRTGRRKGYSLSDDAPQLIERSREFMNKLHSGIEELNG